VTGEAGEKEVGAERRGDAVGQGADLLLRGREAVNVNDRERRARFAGRIGPDNLLLEPRAYVGDRAFHALQVGLGIDSDAGGIEPHGRVGGYAWPRKEQRSRRGDEKDQTDQNFSHHCAGCVAKMARLSIWRQEGFNWRYRLASVRSAGRLALDSERFFQPVSLLTSM
jgi:hypothetical protein